MRLFKYKPHQLISLLAIAGSVGIGGVAQALSLDLAGVTHRQYSLNQSPLFLGAQSEPNILLLMDDSLSMSSSFALDHRESGGAVDKTGSGGARDGGADQAQGMARATNAGRLIYPWLFPRPPGINEADGTCRGNGTVNASNVAALRLPDEEASPFCAQIAPTDYLLESVNNNSWVRTDAGLAANISIEADVVDAWKLRSSSYNPLYFDPNKTYSPWPGVDSSGSSFGNASPTAVRLDPFDASQGTINIKNLHEFDSVVRLTNGSYDTVRHQLYQRSYSCGLLGLFTCTDEFDARYKVAVYYQSNGTEVDLTGLSSSNSTLVNFANWFQYYRNRDLIAKGIAASMVEGIESMRVALATIHQNDSLAVPAISVSGSAGSGDKKTLLDNLYSIQPLATGTPLRRALNDAGNYFRCDAASRYAGYYNSSPVVENQNIVGDNSCPVLDEGSGGECQVHNTILLTDGYSTVHGLPLKHTGYPAETGSQGSSVFSHNSLNPAVDHDSDADTAFDGVPYADGVAGTLADAAMDAYENDLQINLDGMQRMYTHAFLISSEPGSGDVDQILAGTGSWPMPLFTLPGAAPYEPSVSDSFEYAALSTELHHAVENGRGQFLNGLTTASGNSIISAINGISNSSLSGSNITASGASLNDDTLIFTTEYNADNWTGNLIAKQLEDDGSLTQVWEAAPLLTSESSRVILTYNPRRETNVATGYDSGGIPFTVASLEDTTFFGSIPLVGGLSPDLAATLGSLLGLNFIGELVGGLVGAVLELLLAPVAGLLDAILVQLTALGLDGLLDVLGISTSITNDQINYIRGERTNEQQNGGVLRDRYDTVLGPIFSSNPVYVGAPSFDYPDEFENAADIAANSYHSFATAQASRVPMVYVGGNDGMLHGFEAKTGVERIAYVPSQVISELKEFTEPDFIPRAYVDGQISVVDVFGRYPGCPSSNACWRSILVGSLGRGGQGIFALDVTEPGTYDSDGNYIAGKFSENNADELVLWEFTDAGSLSAQAKQTVNDIIQDTLCDALFGLCNLGVVGVFDLSDLIENFIGESIVEPLLDIIIQTDEERGHSGLGYTIVQPNIVHTAADFGYGGDADGSGDWAVIVSNGYNNTEADLGLQDAATSLEAAAPLAFSLTGNAYVFAIDLETGTLVKDFDTEVGAFLDLSQVLLTPGVSVSLPDLTNDASSLLNSINLPTSVPNAMATTAVVDVENDLTVDYVYAGDLVGNLWKLDLTSANVSSWDFAQTSGGDPVAMFQATNFSGVPQPITTEPVVMLHPDYPVRTGQLVIFGTGELLEADSAGEQHYTQSIYGLWDKNDGAVLPTNDKSKYLRRFITDSVSVQIDTDLDGTRENATIRLVSDDSFDGDGDTIPDGPIDWTNQLGWYMDLAEGQNATAVDNADNQGERVVADPLLRNGRLLISTTIPDEGVCSPNISNWLFELNAADGSPPFAPPFDLNGDGSLSYLDRYTDSDGNVYTPAGRFSDGTYNPIPTILITSTGHEVHLTQGANGSFERTIVNPMGFERSRATWRQLR